MLNCETGCGTIKELEQQVEQLKRESSAEIASKLLVKAEKRKEELEAESEQLRADLEEYKRKCSVKDSTIDILGRNLETLDTSQNEVRSLQAVIVEQAKLLAGYAQEIERLRGHNRRCKS